MNKGLAIQDEAPRHLSICYSPVHAKSKHNDPVTEGKPTLTALFVPAEGSYICAYLADRPANRSLTPHIHSSLELSRQVSWKLY